MSILSAFTTTPTILLIDDDLTSLRLVVDYLRAYSIEILTARNGEAGIERALNAQPALILLDVNMPGIDGLETCRRLKSNPATAPIPIIFMTAHADAADKIRGLEAGAVDYLSKPIEMAELLARVRIHLMLRDLQERLEARVQQRTAELEAEIAQRQKNELEREQLFEVMRQQSEQLRTVTQLFLEVQQQQQQGLSQALHDSIRQSLQLLEARLKATQQVLLGLSDASPSAQLGADYLSQAQAILTHLQQQTEQVTTNLTQVTAKSQTLLNNPLLNLSVREREVLHLLVTGHSTTEIAETLVLSKGTVSTYRQRIMDKLAVPDFPSLVKFAMQHHLLSE